MAKKRSTKSTPAKKTTASSETKVTRIKASDKPHKLTPAEKAAKRTSRELEQPSSKPSKTEEAEQKKEKQRRSIGGPFKSLGAYFKGAWYELRQVRWPDRENTWKMTGALLAFCAFFIALILLMDAGFKYLFELMIG